MDRPSPKQINAGLQLAIEFRRKYITDALASGAYDVQVAESGAELFECGCMLAFAEAYDISDAPSAEQAGTTDQNQSGSGPTASVPAD